MQIMTVLCIEDKILKFLDVLKMYECEKSLYAFMKIQLHIRVNVFHQYYQDKSNISVGDATS